MLHEYMSCNPSSWKVTCGWHCFGDKVDMSSRKNWPNCTVMTICIKRDEDLENIDLSYQILWTETHCHGMQQEFIMLHSKCWHLSFNALINNNSLWRELVCWFQRGCDKKSAPSYFNQHFENITILRNSVVACLWILQTWFFFSEWFLTGGLELRRS